MASNTIPTKRTNEIVIRAKYISQHRDVPPSFAHAVFGYVAVTAILCREDVGE